MSASSPNSAAPVPGSKPDPVAIAARLDAISRQKAKDIRLKKLMGRRPEIRAFVTDAEKHKARLVEVEKKLGEAKSEARCKADALANSESTVRACNTRIADLESDLTAAHNRIADLEGSLAAANAGIDVLKNERDTARASIVELEGQLAASQSAPVTPAASKKKQ